MRSGFKKFGGRPEFSWTHLIVYANLILFTWMVIVGILAGFGLKPVLSPSTGLLLHMGGQAWPLVLNKGQWWRCISYAFTHAGLIHLGFNMVVLLQVGKPVERELGKNIFLSLYVFSALTATLAGLIWHPMTPVVGASGSLFGLIGFSIVFFHRLGGPMARQQRNMMLQWAVFAFVFGLMVGADNAGHLGGALGGALIGLIFPLRSQTHPENMTFFKFLGITSIVLICYGLGGLALSWVGI
ncbi:MAG: rhomboid family intramembrane serine protease [Deltaproteobacteria bacterium]|nr:rhomboid family intramembrane serine protease [Deltaproteobacteria bacterium]